MNSSEISLATCGLFVFSIFIKHFEVVLLFLQVSQRKMITDYIQDKHLCERCVKRCQVEDNQDIN